MMTHFNSDTPKDFLNRELYDLKHITYNYLKINLIIDLKIEVNDTLLDFVNDFERFKYMIYNDQIKQRVKYDNDNTRYNCKVYTNNIYCVDNVWKG
jgi:hypothetical protein